VFDFNESYPSPTDRIQDYVCDAALDALSCSMVASNFLTPTSETLYLVLAARYSETVARPAKHTRPPYIHETFPRLLYQTRKGGYLFRTISTVALTPDLLSLFRLSQRPDRSADNDAPLLYFDARSGKS